MQAKKYPIKMRIMHWTMSPLILLMLIAGLYMTSDFVSNQYKFQIYGIHKSVGILIILLLFTRFIIRQKSKVPSLPKEISKMDQKLATAGHHTMYLFMLLVPLSGYLMSAFGGYPVKMFGIPIPSIFEKNTDLGGFFHTAHWFLNYIFIGLILVHLVAPFKHYFIDKVNVWKRMV